MAAFSLRTAAATEFTVAPFDAARTADIADIRFFGAASVLVNRVEWAHEVLVEKASSFRKGPLLSVAAKPLIGEGLLSGPNELNRRQRRVISPAFAHRKIVDYAETVTRYTASRIATWRDGHMMDAAQEMIAITLGVMGELLLSADLLGASEDVGKAITILMRFAIDEHAAPLRAIRTAPRALKALFFLNRTLYRRIDERRRAGDETKALEADLLSLLLFTRDESTGGPYMSDKLIRDETMTLFLAGLETVAMGLTWSLYVLDQYPKIRKRAVAEVDSVLTGRVPTPEDLPRLPYTLAVFKESMRLYPPVYIVARQALEPVQIGDRLLRRGEVVLVSPYVQHRQPAHFPDPLRFDPERWSDADAEKRLPSRYAYMPFGTGPRVCVGGHFAMMESHLILALLLQRVILRRTDGEKCVELEPLFTLRPRGGLPMSIQTRAFGLQDVQ